MKSPTLRERIVTALIAKGEIFVESKSSKFIKLTATHSAHKGYYFVGKKRALRFGSSIKTSIPVSEKFYDALIGEMKNEA